ncbi:MAG: FIG074102: hypothetical protein [uncultured Thermomicrobiales bacterium]|uniref:DUF4385 domain-containing protein n=1 Tax=uncultured Thermomicrobiales bacterium TaxID=1645740 RepID=A0A6J4VJG5_9BACT|nr:MAG: FIG074102: hypothetical protein [uncultured Thermomicrobiales bacterium]
MGDGGPHPLDGIDFRAEPERYEIGRGEHGVFHVEPYKGELLPLWTVKDLAAAERSAAAIHDRFLAYRTAGDFVGMDMARKYLQMGFTRARRYANYRGGRKRAPDGNSVPFGSGDPRKAQIADLFRTRWRAVAEDPEYLRLKALHQRARRDAVED